MNGKDGYRRRTKEHDVDGYFEGEREFRYTRDFTSDFYSDIEEEQSLEDRMYEQEQQFLQDRENDPRILRGRALWEMGLAMLKRERGEEKSSDQLPDIEDQYLATWSETLSSADIHGGTLLKPFNKKQNGFDSYEDASIWGPAMIAENDADGGVILEFDTNYFVYSIKPKAWIEEFTRNNIESGFDKLTTDTSEVKGIMCFITKDGYLIPTTAAASAYPGKPTYIVDKKWEGGYWKSARLPDPSGYRNIAKERKKGNDLDIGEKAGLALFKGMLKVMAIERLKRNREELNELERKYAEKGQGQSETDSWLRLRRILAKDSELAEKKDKIKSIIKRLNVFDGLMGGTRYSLEMKLDYQRSIEHIQKVRLGIRKDYPVLNTIDTSKIDDTTTNDVIYQRMSEGFTDIREALATVERHIHEDDMPLFKLGALIDDVKAELGITQEKADQGDNLSKAALTWLSDKDFTDKLITYGGTAGTIAFTIAAAVKTGGASLVLGSLAVSSGLATSLYELDQADSLYDVAKAQRAGGGNLSNQAYEDAKFDYVMGWINLVLAGLDVGLISKGIPEIAKSQPALRKLISLPGAEVLSELTPVQINRFFNSKQYLYAGKVKRSENVSNVLKKELAPQTYEKAVKYFNQATIDDVVEIAIKGYDDLTSEAFLKMRALYPNKPVQEHHWIVQAVISGEEPHELKDILMELKIDIRKAGWNMSVIPHEGRHTDKYFEFIEEELDSIYDAYKESGSNWSKEDMEKVLIEVTKEVKKAIVDEKVYMYHVK